MSHLAAKSPHIWFIGFLSFGGLLYLPSSVYSAVEKSQTEEHTIPENPIRQLQLSSDRQSYDPDKKVFVAEGDAKAKINGYWLQADRIEFDRGLKTLYAKGRVRFYKGSQYFQASSLRYSFIEQEGKLEDVYGVIDLATLDKDLEPITQSYGSELEPNELLEISKNRIYSQDYLLQGSTKNELEQSINQNLLEAKNNLDASSLKSSTNEFLEEDIACPPLLPSIPDWHPKPWALTLWGGQMSDSELGESFLFNGKFRSEYLYGLGLKKRFYKSGPFALEFVADWLQHFAGKQLGGGYNQSEPFSKLSAQNFSEFVLGLGAKVWVRPWLSFGIIEGISYNNVYSNYERTYRDNYSKLLNYLGFEIEAKLSKSFSLVGRIHHRSGAFGTFGGTREGSNAYILGFRTNWGSNTRKDKLIAYKAPIGCANSNQINSEDFLLLEKELEDFKTGKIHTHKREMNQIDKGQGSGKGKTFKPLSSSYSILSLAEKETIRSNKITSIDQRIRDLSFRDSITLQGKFGVPSLRNFDGQSRSDALRVDQLRSSVRKGFLTGSVNRWRIQANVLEVTQKGWKAERMSFTNDPLTPSQTRIDATNVVGTEEENGDILIKTLDNRLILEERISIPILRHQRIREKDQIDNKWVLGIDNKDRDGFFIGRQIKPIELGKEYELSLQPQLLLQRAFNGKTNSYIESGKDIYSNKVSSTANITDLFGLKAGLTGKKFGWDINANADISTFNFERFNDGTRYSLNLTRALNLPFLDNVETKLFGAYRYRAWNGSLGETDIYSAYGAFFDKKIKWNWGRFDNNYLFRVGAGNYKAETYGGESISGLWRANIYSSLNSNYVIWSASNKEYNLDSDYRYSPVPISPGLTINTKLSTAYFAYEDGRSQNTLSLSGGPTLTLGRFTKPFLDYTKLSITAGGTLKQGGSPFDFDEAIDLGTLGIGLSQQIAGPLLLNAGVGLNIDGGSEHFGKAINSRIELKWKRRSYDFSLFYRPYDGIGGLTVNLNDFNYGGTGIPFAPIGE